MLCIDVAILVVFLVIHGKAEVTDHFSNFSDDEVWNCPSWFVVNTTSGKCQCGDSLGGIVSCNDEEGNEQNSVMDCYCMTHSEEQGTVVGACFYNCEDSRRVFSRDFVYHPMPLNVSELNKAMCERRFNRAGRLCGRCNEGYFPSAYSYDLKCRKCPSKVMPGNWIRYFVISFVPLTVFFIVVLILRISATSPRLLAYVFVAQSLSSPTNVRLILLALENHPAYLFIAKTVLGLYGIWNLDFFRTYYPPFCLNVSTLQVLALDYLVAIYPLILVAVTYLLIQLHGRGCLLVVILWMPFKKFHSKYQEKLDPSSSIVDVFASFLVFSSNRFLYTTCDLLTPTPLYDVNGTKLGLYLYYDATYKYFGQAHLPYGIFAIVVGLVFIILPVVLLLLYPIRKTQMIWGNWQILRFFVESFQGYFKDGITEGKHDFRYFSATFLIARILLFMVYAAIPNSLFFPVMVTPVAFLILLLATLKPYKKKYSIYGKVEIVLLSLFLIWFALCTSRLLAAIKQPQYVPIFLGFVGTVGSLPLLYLPILIGNALWNNDLRRNLTYRTKFYIKSRVCTVPIRRGSVVSRKSQDEMTWLLECSIERGITEDQEENETKRSLVKSHLDLY